MKALLNRARTTRLLIVLAVLSTCAACGDPSFGAGW